MATVKARTDRRKATVRRAIKEAATGRARLTVFRSSKHIYAQVIDDAKGVTVAAASRRRPPAGRVFRCIVPGNTSTRR